MIKTIIVCKINYSTTTFAADIKDLIFVAYKIPFFEGWSYGLFCLTVTPPNNLRPKADAPVLSPDNK